MPLQWLSLCLLPLPQIKPRLPSLLGTILPDRQPLRVSHPKSVPAAAQFQQPSLLFPHTTLTVGDSMVRNRHFVNTVTLWFPGATVPDILVVLPRLPVSLLIVRMVTVLIGTNDNVHCNSELTKGYFILLSNLLNSSGRNPFVSGSIPTMCCVDI